MTVGYFKEGKTQFLLEARAKNGQCMYRKYTGDDRFKQKFELVPPTKCGIKFRVTVIQTEQEKNQPLVAHPKVTDYISRQIGRLSGLIDSPESINNAIAKATFGKRGHVQRIDHNKDQILDGIMPEPPPAEAVEGTILPEFDVLKTLSDERIKALSGASSLPWDEPVPEGEFDADAWARGELEVARPSQIAPSTPGGPIPVTVPGPESQFAVKGPPKEARSARIKREQGKG